MGRLWLVPLLFVLGVCGSGTAEACTCSSRSAACGPPAEFWRASAVFVGDVSAVERVKGQSYQTERRVQVRVLERFRGALPAEPAEVAVFTDAPSRCGYPFKAGQRYLIYAVRQDDGRLTVSSCSRTTPLDRAGVDLTYARRALTGDVPPGRIVGEVRQATEDPARWKPIANLSVAMVRSGARISAVTDAKGRYTIEAPAVGTYTLDLSLPANQYTLQAAQSVVLHDPRACVEANIDILFNGLVTGRVVDSAGRGVAGLTVSYASSRSSSWIVQSPVRMLTRDDGTFEIDRLPPGGFVMAIELPAGDGVEEPLAPAAIEKRGTLGPGQRLTLDPLVLPSVTRIAKLAGTVHAPDGSPAPNARVFLKNPGEPGHILGAPATTDSLGRFVLAVLEGESYQVFAERQSAASPSSAEFSDPVTVKVSVEPPPLRLTVRRRF